MTRLQSTPSISQLMRAVNLLPTDLRGALRRLLPTHVRSVSASKASALTWRLVHSRSASRWLAVYVMASNNVKQKQTDLTAAQVQADAATQAATKLKPYADFEATAQARVATVRDLAAARFDWEQSLRDLSRALPHDVPSLKAPGASRAPAARPALRSVRAIDAPAISLDGCATSQNAVARMLARLRAVRGVTRVSPAELHEDRRGRPRASTRRRARRLPAAT